jgi:hypothetical protein
VCVCVCVCDFFSNIPSTYIVIFTIILNIHSIVEFSSETTANAKDVMDLLLLTQYFDMIRDVGSSPHCRTTFVPTSRSMGDEIRGSLIQANAATMV